MSLSSCLDTTLCCQLVDLSKVMKLTAVAAVKDTYNIRGHSYIFWNRGEKLRIVKAFFFVSTKGGVGTEPDVPQSSAAHPLLQTPEVRASIKTANKNRSGNFTTAESFSKAQHTLQENEYYATSTSEPDRPKRK